VISLSLFRNHLNDLENVIPFVLFGFLYTMTNPSLGAALLHFRVFTASRILHTISYQLPLRQPFRGLSFIAGFVVTTSMAIQVLMTVA
jgi:glutathione S-transferase